MEKIELPTSTEIGQKLGRSAQAIRFLRYRKGLAPRIREETGILAKQKAELIGNIQTLQNQKTSLTYEVNNLTKKKQNLEDCIRTDRIMLEQTLAQALLNLKQQRPELFTLSGAEQIAMLLKIILK